MLLSFGVLFIHLLLRVSAEVSALRLIKPTPGLSLSTVARFFVFGNGLDNSTTTEWISSVVHQKPNAMPPKGWGLYDASLPDKLAASVNFKNLGFKEKGVVGSLAGNSAFELVVIDYTDFWERFIPFQKSQHFCCTENDVLKPETTGCQKADRLILPHDLINVTTVVPIPHHHGNNDDVNSQIVALNKSGIFFVLLVNCSPRTYKGSFSGEMVVESSLGYLSGIDAPKLEFYAVLTIAYLSLSGIWLIICLRYISQLAKLHHVIGTYIFTSLLESGYWYWMLSWYNSTPNASTAILFVALGLTTLKNVFAMILVILQSLGYGITRPSLETVTWRKLSATAIIFSLFEFLRQIGTQFHTYYELSVTLILLCAMPISLIYTGCCLWCYSSLKNIIDELRKRHQIAKLEQMVRYRNVLIITCLTIGASLIVQTLVMSMDARKVWVYEWIFTDAIPNTLMFSILVVFVTLWRPSRSSLHYSYNLQLPSTENDLYQGIDRIRAEVKPATIGDLGGGSKNAEAGTLQFQTGNYQQENSRRNVGWGELDMDLEIEADVDPATTSLGSRTVSRGQ